MGLIRISSNFKLGLYGCNLKNEVDISNGGLAIEFFLHKCLMGGVERVVDLNNYNAHPNRVDWTGVWVWG